MELVDAQLPGFFAHVIEIFRYMHLWFDQKDVIIAVHTSSVCSTVYPGGASSLPSLNFRIWASQASYPF